MADIEVDVITIRRQSETEQVEWSTSVYFRGLKLTHHRHSFESGCPIPVALYTTDPTPMVSNLPLGLRHVSRLGLFL